MIRIAILGSTGSIGRNTLDVIRRFPDKFQVIGLSANSNIKLLYRQIKEFHPAFVAVNDARLGRKLKSGLKSKTQVFIGEDGLEELIQHKLIDKIVLAISGSAALKPLLKAIETRKVIALANKEALVMAGPIIIKKAEAKKVKIIPVDSEQSAIWQCLDSQDSSKLRNIYLTASGGTLRKFSQKKLKSVLRHEVLRHPCWRMGEKISVDSATLMNKGLEVLEAMFLFNIAAQKIKIVIHPQAIIHSMVEFIDGVILAQLSITDMRIPIQYAIAYPQRLKNAFPSVDFFQLKRFDFEKPDERKFPCLGLAYRAADEIGTMPSVLNAANEASVEAFLKNRLKFMAIPQVIEKVMDRHRKIKHPGLEEILAADYWARNEAAKIIQSLRN
ncbi:MAG: 1-deoxy-D-xylulose-5-phosphate reductoisomerase [Candidatus Omnitrophica bacterium]|nr:1-deoxy-D-xylulose-5-phosphate reductoisomerase [Candidatus Omnitrophota bacterium]